MQTTFNAFTPASLADQFEAGTLNAQNRQRGDISNYGAAHAFLLFEEGNPMWGTTPSGHQHLAIIECRRQLAYRLGIAAWLAPTVADWLGQSNAGLVWESELTAAAEALSRTPFARQLPPIVR